MRRIIRLSLSTPRAADFDFAIQHRFDRIHIISDLVDYRLRYVQHVSKTDPDGANHNHAIFFCWWPTHEVAGKRGKTLPNKSVTPRTMRSWWKRLERSAIFVYLIHKHGFQQLPMGTDDLSFVDDLIRELNNKEIIRFLGAYAYVVETFTKAHSDLFYVPVPASIPRI